MKENQKDTQKIYAREVQKRYEKMGKVKADVGAAPLAYTIFVYAFAVLALFGLLFGIMNMSSVKTLGIISLAVSGTCAVLLVLMYFIASRKGSTRYVEVAIKYEGKFLLFQIIDERHVIFSDGEYTLEYEKKQVKERPQGILNPQLSFDAPLSATYEAVENKGMKTIYVGKKDSGDPEKPYVYKVSCEGKFVTGFKMNGKSVTFDGINEKGVSLGIPAMLIEEIQKRGTSLPAKEIVVSQK